MDYDQASAALSPSKYEEAMRPPAWQGGPTANPANHSAPVYQGGGATLTPQTPEQYRAASDAEVAGKVTGSGIKRGHGSVENWAGAGRFVGNRPGDQGTLDEATGKYMTPESSQQGAPELPTADLSKLKLEATETQHGHGVYTRRGAAAGRGAGAEGQFQIKTAYDNESGTMKPTLAGPEAWAAAGGMAERAVGIKGEAEGRYGKVEGQLEAGVNAHAGASAGAKMNEKGVSAEAAVSAGVEAYAKGHADYTTPALQVGGITDDLTTPLTAGVGVNGEAGASLKAGAGGGAYLNWEDREKGPKIGVTGGAGLMAAVEAKGDIHGHIGPVAGTLEGSVMAGAALGIEGSILYEDGKLTIGGRAYAALGYGGKVGGSVTIDLRQSAELGYQLLKRATEIGIEGAQRAFHAADADGDGVLTAKDAAEHGVAAMDATADAAESMTKGMISTLDTDGDGKLSWGEVGGAAQRAGSAVVGVGQEAAGAVYQAGKDGVEAVGSAISSGVAKTGEALSSSATWVGEQLGAASTYASQRVADAQATLHKAHAFIDRNGDGISTDELVTAASEVGQAAMAKGSELGQAAVAKGSELVTRGANAASDAATSVKKAAVAATDYDGDGEFDLMSDGKAALEQAGQATVAAGRQVYHKAQATRTAVVEAVTNAPAAIEAGLAKAGERVTAAGTEVKRRAVQAGTYAVQQIDAAAAKGQELLQQGEELLTAASKITPADAYRYAEQKTAAAGRAVSEGWTAVSEGAASAAQNLSDAGTRLSQGASAAGSRISAAASEGWGFVSGLWTD